MNVAAARIRPEGATKGRVTMKAKRLKEAPAVIPAVSGSDHAVLVAAYKSGLILGWKLDHERGYRLTLVDRRDDYVETTKLSAYVEKLRKEAS
jgi:hypothetical protein